jgi:4-hydroxy-tetrahydrodipicolinate reductase
MGSLVAEAVCAADGLELGPLYDPGHGGDEVAGSVITERVDTMVAADVVVEFTEPGVVMGNLARWRSLGLHAVVGTSGFDQDRLDALTRQWGSGPPNCLVVPNFSIGAVVMMRLSEIAAPHFAAAEVIEMHHDHKADAPSGTAIATAGRISRAAGQHRAVESVELTAGARGADVDGVPVHAVRLPGLIAHQEVLFGSTGETLTIRHDTTDRGAFMPGVLAAVRAVVDLEAPVTVGLEPILGIG